MLRSFELRLRVNRVQAAALSHVLVDSCETYNAALEERIGAWKLQRKSVGYYEQCAELTELRKDPQFARIALDIQREPLRRLDRAFKAFFRRCKAGQKPGFPRFRSRHRYDSFAAASTGFKLGERHITIAKLGSFRFKSHRPLEGEPQHVTVKRLGKKWVAKVVCDIGEAPPKVAISTAIGIDLGLTTFAVLSDGTEVPNPCFIRKHADRIAIAQRNLSRKKRGGKNRLKAKERARRTYQRMADARKNFCHHVSQALVERYDLIAHEDLNIANMVRGHFAKSIMDAAWGQFLFQLAYKADKAGRYVIAVNPRGTTQRCSGCSEKVPKKLSERWHSCPHCGLSLGRDHNAALNILALAPGRGAAGVSAEGPNWPTTQISRLVNSCALAITGGIQVFKEGVY